MQNWIIFDEKICIVIVLWANRRTRTIIYTFISKLFLVLKWVFFFSSYKMLKTLLVFWVSPSFFLHRINDSLRPLEAKRKIERVWWFSLPACLFFSFEVTLFKVKLKNRFIGNRLIWRIFPTIFGKMISTRPRYTTKPKVSYCH
jgi:hypothetical protein